MVAKRQLKKPDGRTRPGVEPAGQFLNYYKLMILFPGEVWLQSGNSKNGRKDTTGSGARGSISKLLQADDFVSRGSMVGKRQLKKRTEGHYRERSPRVNF